MRIRTKFIIIFLILSLTPLAIVGVIAYQNGKKTIEENLGESYLQAAHVITERIDRSLYEVYNNIQTWAELDITQEIITDDVDGKISTFLIDLGREYGYFSYINALNIQGEVVASSNLELIGRNFKFKLENFYKNSNGGKAYMEDAYLDEISKHWVVSFFFTVKAKFDIDKIIGFLFSAWNLFVLSLFLPSGVIEAH